MKSGLFVVALLAAAAFSAGSVEAQQICRQSCLRARNMCLQACPPDRPECRAQCERNYGLCLRDCGQRL
jgi:hypothetical protein